MGALLWLLGVGVGAAPGVPRGDPAARILAWVCCPARAARSPQALNQQFLPSRGARAAPTAPLLPGWLQACRDQGALPVGRGCSGPSACQSLLPVLTPGLVHLQLALSGLVGIVSWKRPLTLVVGVGGTPFRRRGGPGWGGRATPPVPPGAPPAPCSAGSPSPPAADRLLHAALGAGRHAEPRRLHPVVPERAAGEDPGGLREGEAEQGTSGLVPGCGGPVGCAGGSQGDCTASRASSQCFLSPGEGHVCLLPGPLGAPARLLQPAERAADHVPQRQLPEHPCGAQGGGAGGCKGSLGSGRTPGHALRALQLTPLLPRISSSVSVA